MDAEVRQQSADLIDALRHDAREYPFFQLVRVLERACEERGLRGVAVDKWLRFAPGPSLAFPASDVLDCQVEDQHIRVELGFMGLYGVDAPLPHYFLDLAAADDVQSAVLRRFLDLFSHRFYALLYLAWRKYRPHTHGGSAGGASPVARYLSALAGGAASRDGGALTYAGLFGARRRTAAGLTGMVEAWLGGALPVRVEQFQPVWVCLADETRLGAPAGCRLGEDTMLGERVLDCAGRIALRVGPAPLDAVLPLLPGRARGEALAELVQRYLGPTLPFEVLFIIDVPAGQASRLGADALVLGCAVWLGESGGATYPIRIPGTAYGADTHAFTRSDS